MAPAPLAEPNRLDLMAAGLNTTLRHLRRSALLGSLAAAAVVVPWAHGEEAASGGSAARRMPAAESLVIREPWAGGQVPSTGGQPATGREFVTAWRPQRIAPQPRTTIHAAALRQRAGRPQPAGDVSQGQPSAMPGYSADSLRQSAAVLIEEAVVKLDSRAYLTAGAKAIEALQWLAQAADAQAAEAKAAGAEAAGAADRGDPAGHDLAIALTAIREAEDFVGKFGTVDSAAIARMVRSHGTDFLKSCDTSNLNGLAAADIYLDGSRRSLATLAAADPLAAEALRVLAQSYRLRDAGTPLGLATSVHLMRAAAGGAPNDRAIAVDLARTLQAAGLHDESQWAAMQVARLSSPGGVIPPSMIVADEAALADGAGEGALRGAALLGSERGQVQLMQVSPEQFAAISPLAGGPPSGPRSVGTATSAGDQAAVGRRPTDQASNPSASHSLDASRFSRALEPIRRLWQ